jgi:hypothetical protein
MPKPNGGQAGKTQKATRDDLQHILGEMDDETAIAILALDPNVAQIEEANVWLSGGAEVLAKEHRPVDAVVSQILDLIAIEEEEEPPVLKR